MKCKYAVTFEFDTLPPLCIRGIAEGTAPNTIASRAIREARSKGKPRNWGSLVVLLERLDQEKGEENDPISEGGDREVPELSGISDNEQEK